MNFTKMTLLLTVAGLVGAVSLATGSGLSEKVEGVLRKDFSIRLDGNPTELHPIIINGTSYLPVRDTAKLMGYDVNWNENKKEILLDEKKSGWITEGVVAATMYEDGDRRLELVGKPVKGEYSIIILSLNENTVISDADGEDFAVDNIVVGTYLTANFGPVVLDSYPSIGHANKLIVRESRSIAEGVVQTMEKTEAGWRVAVKNADGLIEMTMNERTVVFTEQGESIDISEWNRGDKIRAYYSMDTGLDGKQSRVVDVAIHL